MLISYLLMSESLVNTRKCRNWQTSKTKDLVTVRSCGFKSHLPQSVESLEYLIIQVFRAFFFGKNDDV